MGPVVKALAIVGNLWGLIGITNIFAGWTSEDPSYDAFLLMFNALVFVVPGGIVAGLTPFLRNGPRAKGDQRGERLILYRAKRWEKAGHATTRP